MAESSMESIFAAEGIFRQLLDAAPDAMVVVDPAGKIVLVNAQTERIFEYSREELVGRPLELLVPEPFRQRHAGHRAAFHGEPRARPMGAGLELFARRKNGTQFPVEISLSPLEFCGVKLVYSAIRDISERKAAEETRRGLWEKDLLLSEIHHRVKNNLQVVSSLLNLQAGQLADPAARHMFEASQSRIRSMALVHEQLYQSGDFAGVDFSTYLRVLAADLLNSYRSYADSVNVRVAADHARLSMETAIPCGLIVNELVSNSLKHAFPQGSTGEIRIAFRGQEQTYSLSVDDNGVPLPADLLTRDSKSMGLRLVKVLTRQLDGELRAGKPGGPKFEIVFPREARRK
jgi:two-component system, sensor histidine kinase PdtaS